MALSMIILSIIVIFGSLSIAVDILIILDWSICLFFIIYSNVVYELITNILGYFRFFKNDCKWILDSG